MTAKTTSELCDEIFGARPHPDSTEVLRKKFWTIRMHLEACELYERVRSAAYAGIEIGKVEGRRELLTNLGDFIDNADKGFNTETHGRAILLHDLVDWMVSKGYEL